jgi:hypothetical protein
MSHIKSNSFHTALLVVTLLAVLFGLAGSLVPASAQSPTEATPPAIPRPNLAGVMATGKGRLLITNSVGQRIGYAGDRFVNEIPGADKDAGQPASGKAVRQVYWVPLNESYTLLLDASSLVEPETALLEQFGPAYTAMVRDIPLTPGEQDVLQVLAGGGRIQYQPGTDKKLSLFLAYTFGNESRQVEVQSASLFAGQTAVLEYNQASDRALFHSSLTRDTTFDLKLLKSGLAGEQAFSSATLLTLPAGQVEEIEFGAWNSGAAPLAVRPLNAPAPTTASGSELEQQIMHFLVTLWVQWTLYAGVCGLALLVLGIAGYAVVTVSRRRDRQKGLIRKKASDPTPSQAVIARQKELKTAIEYLQEGKPDLAFKLLRELAVAEPDDALVWMYLGLACQQRQDIKGAIFCFRKADELGHPRAAEMLERVKEKAS